MGFSPSSQRQDPASMFALPRPIPFCPVHLIWRIVFPKTTTRDMAHDAHKQSRLRVEEPHRGPAHLLVPFSPLTLRYLHILLPPLSPSTLFHSPFSATHPTEILPPKLSLTLPPHLICHAPKTPHQSHPNNQPRLLPTSSPAAPAPFRPCLNWFTD